MWGKKDEITELPSGIEYLKDTKELNLVCTNIDMIPRGLKGVNIVRMPEKPKYISPDFGGDIYIHKGSDTYEKLPMIDVYKAIFSYRQNPDFVESDRYVGNSSLERIVLPANIHFYERDEKVYLDLTRTSIVEKPKVVGIDEVIMPRKLFRYRGHQMVYSKSRIKE